MIAFSSSCRNQAFCLEGYPVYGTQFHAELLPKQLVERLTMFRQYMPDDEEFEADFSCHDELEDDHDFNEPDG